MQTAGADWLGAVYDVLSDSRRRDVLYELESIEEGSVDELTTAVVGRERSRKRDSSAVDPAQVRLSLCHTHLPMLAELSVIEYEPSTGRVARGNRFDEVNETVSKVRRYERRGAGAPVDNWDH